MDITNRSTQPQSFQPGGQPSGPNGSPATYTKTLEKKLDKLNFPKWYHLVTTTLLVVIVLLVLSLTGLIFTSKPETQGKFVDTKKLQAVFLNTGQVYFGHISSLNNQYFVLNNIYYLQTASTDTTKAASSNNISLVKLGCELHRPSDTMIINRDQVTFWENLQSDGQVAKAVADFTTKNPNGQKCSDTTGAPAAAGATVQGGAATTPTSTNTTKKP